MIGQKIAGMRADSCLTQEQLAEKLFVSRELISKWENGRRIPDHGTILRLAEIFGCDPDDIFDRDEMLLNELSDCIPDELCSDGERLKIALNAFLSELKERERSVFVRRYYFMEDIPIIAEKYVIRESNVRTVLMRTRKKLKKFLEEAGK